MSVRSRAVLLPLAVLSAVSAPAAAPVRTGHAEAELVAEASSVPSAGSFRAALRLRPDPGWHVYWKNPGDAGMPPKLLWELPAGWSAGPLEFPSPARIETPPFASYGYKSEAGYPLRIVASPGAVAGDRVRLRAKAEWLICADECLPESAELSLEIGVGEARADSARAAWWRALEAKLPVPAPARNWRVALDDATLRLSWDAPEGDDPGEVLFFPEVPGVITHAAPQVLVREGDRLALAVERDAVIAARPDTLRGVLVASNGWNVDGATRAALAVAVPLAAPSAGGGALGLLAVSLLVLAGLAVLVLMKRPHVHRRPS